jgi:hypothetical protein
MATVPVRSGATLIVMAFVGRMSKPRLDEVPGPRIRLSAELHLSHVDVQGDHVGEDPVVLGRRSQIVDDGPALGIDGDSSHRARP